MMPFDEMMTMPSAAESMMDLAMASLSTSDWANFPSRIIFERQSSNAFLHALWSFSGVRYSEVFEFMQFISSCRP